MTAGDIRERHMIKIDGKICQVVERTTAGTGKLGKTVHFRLKSIEDGHQLERRFRLEERVDRIDVERQSMEFLYQDGDEFVFMDQANFEQFTLPAKVIGSLADFLKANTKIDVLSFEGKPIHIELPKTMDIHVSNAPPGTGSGQNSAWKEVELENGVKVLAPQFIKAGDMIRVDVDERKYLERIQEQ